MVRVVVIWLVLMTALAAFGAPPSSASTTAPALSSWVLTIAMLGFAAFAAVGTSTSRLLWAARHGHVVVDAAAPTWRLWRRVWARGLIAAVLLLAVCSVAEMSRLGAFAGPLLGGYVGVVVGALMRLPKTAAPVSRSLVRWLVIEGAVPTAVAAAALGGILATVRFGVDGTHGAAPVARMLAGTFLCDALLGFGAFAKAFTERRFRFVDAPSTTSLPEVPGPVIVALALAACTVIVGPHVLPAMSSTTVIATKSIASGVVAFALTLLGAVRGAAAAAKAS
ncbi:MAG TPA: hypothetical protein VGF99_00125 [Myxococcota bacterium]